jgi:hypothetical protein
MQASVVLRRGRPWLLGSMIALVVSLALPSFAAAEPWPNEEAMRNSEWDLARDTFVYDPGIGHDISRGNFVGPLAGYYGGKGFDANFLDWAPVDKLNLGSAEWSGCVEASHPEPCPAADIHWGTVSHAVSSGQITVLHWGDAFISIVCGNFSRHGAAGPIPQITGVKYEDMNANGKRDPGDPGLSGWTMKLFYEGNYVTSTTTDAQGHYVFKLDADNLPSIGAGSYQVKEGQQSGWVASQVPGSVNVSFGVGNKTYSGNDFGNYRPAKLGGHKFDDSNVSGTRDPFETGLEGWTIPLSNGEQRVTDGEGGFSFSVRPGTYTLHENLKSGWRQTSPGGEGTRTYTVVSGQVVEDADFGNVCLGGASVSAVDDSTGEPVSMEVRLEEGSVPGILENEPSLPRTAPETPTTFGELLPGSYRVVAFLPEGVYTTDPDVEPVEGRFAIVKDISVQECETTSLVLHTITESTPGAFVTGGVEIALPEEFATSGFEFMTEPNEPNEPRGTLQYNDHFTGLDLHTSLIDLIYVSGDEAIVWGRVPVGEDLQVFSLRLVDAGEPGIGVDRYELTLASGYKAGQGETLSGGNVKIHEEE